jgi:hypothetical protein
MGEDLDVDALLEAAFDKKGSQCKSFAALLRKECFLSIIGSQDPASVGGEGQRSLIWKCGENE